MQVSYVPTETHGCDPVMTPWLFGSPVPLISPCGSSLATASAGVFLPTGQAEPTVSAHFSN